MLTEFRAGRSKADLAILNGTSTVYEIKSDLDSLVRLRRQVEDYARVFANIYVVAGDKHVAAVMSAVPREIGVLTLNGRTQLQTLRRAQDRADCVDPLAIFESVRTVEATEILLLLGRSAPAVPNTRIRSALRPLFADLAPRDVHDAFVATLRKTRNMEGQNDFIQALPPSVRAAGLTISLRRPARERVLDAMETKIGDAVRWSS